MKKSITILSFLLLNIGVLFSQDFDWAKTIVSDRHEEFHALEIDDEGNTLTLGNFENTIQLSGVTLEAVGQSNIFLAKHNPEGDILWVKIIDGGIATGEDLEIDKDGNIIMLGYFEYAIDFGNTNINAGAGSNIFLAKLDPTGEVIWVKHSTHTDNIATRAFSVETDNNGDIIIAGSTIGSSTTATVNFDGTEVTNNGFFDALILKYSTDGDLLWLDTAGSNNADLAYNVAIDDNNNIYITGIFAQQVIFGATDTLTSTALGQEDMFLLKYRPNGNLVWSKQSNPNILARGQHVGFSEGHLFLTGYFLFDMEFEGAFIAPPDSAAFNNYLSKLDTLGNVIYTRPYANCANVMATRGLDFDENGNPFVLGRYQGEGITDDNVVMSNVNTQDNFMLTQHDKTTGEILKLWHGGGEGYDVPYDLAVKHSGEIYFAGKTSSLELTFQDTTLIFPPSSLGTYNSGFLIKLLDENFVNVFTPELLHDIVAYPNPTIDFLTIDLGENKVETSVQVFDISGKNISEKYFYHQQLIELPTDSWAKGMYFLKIKIGNQFATLKIMK